MPITKIKLSQFTVFEKLEIEFSPGINIFIGENGTGKTHLLKALYAACDVSKSGKSFAEKLTGVFVPSGMATGRLVRRQKLSSKACLEVLAGDASVKAEFSNHVKKWTSAEVKTKKWKDTEVESVFIPVKEMLTHAPGFRSLYSTREISFDETYADIIDKAFLPPLRGPESGSRKRLADILRKSLQGTVIQKNEQFYLKSKLGELEFSLLAEGISKLGLLWLLIKNGTLEKGSVLFWDEPESNINPHAIENIVKILLELQREGLQIFLASHNYVLLKHFDLHKKHNDAVLFHSLYWEENADTEEPAIQVNSTSVLSNLQPNLISEAYSRLYDLSIDKELGVGKQ